MKTWVAQLLPNHASQQSQMCLCAMQLQPFVYNSRLSSQCSSSSKSPKKSASLKTCTLDEASWTLTKPGLWAIFAIIALPDQDPLTLDSLLFPLPRAALQWGPL